MAVVTVPAARTYAGYARQTTLRSGLPAIIGYRSAYPYLTQKVIEAAYGGNVKVPITGDGLLPPTGVMKGRVTFKEEDGSFTPVPLCRVYCYIRDNKKLIAAAKTDADGYYTLKDLVYNVPYFVIAFDVPGPPVMNSIILDRVVAAAP